MEVFKSFDTLLDVDKRWSFFLGGKDDELTPTSLAAEYNEVAAIELSANAPEAVRSQFSVAKMLRVYAAFYMPFTQMAELKAYATLEMALRSRFPSLKGMKSMLNAAVNSGLVTDAGFSHIKASPQDPTSYSRTLPLCISKLRNSHAHGTTQLHIHSVANLRICAQIINQIYPEDDRLAT